MLTLRAQTAIIKNLLGLNMAGQQLPTTPAHEQSSTSYQCDNIQPSSQKK